MKAALCAALAALLPVAVFAQNQPPITSEPLLPPSRQYAPSIPQPAAPAQPGVPAGQPFAPGQPAAPPAAPAFPSVQQPSPSGAAPGAVQPGGAEQPPAPGATPQTQGATPQPEAPPQPPPPNPWVAQGTAVLQVLDKPNAQSKTLTVKVGQSATYGSLTIKVEACMIRPPDLPPDATAFLVITDQHADQPGFHGWMLHSDPSLAMLQHPVYDVRVLGCAP